MRANRRASRGDGQSLAAARSRASRKESGERRRRVAALDCPGATRKSETKRGPAPAPAAEAAAAMVAPARESDCTVAARGGKGETGAEGEVRRERLRGFAVSPFLDFGI